VTKKILIVGATSAIAEAVARHYAAQGAQFFLVARNEERLGVIAADLLARGASDVKTFVMDAHELARLPEFLEAAWRRLVRIDIALIAHGTLPDQVFCETDIDYAVKEFRTNAESVISCLMGLGKRFERQGSGVIAVIGSVAGDRGRGSNYLYGAAKAAVDAFASGLRRRLFEHGVHVLTIKPGFVDTPMIRNLQLPKALVVSAESVAADIIRSIAKKRDVLYTPWFWRFIMLIILHIPNVVFKRLKL